VALFPLATTVSALAALALVTAVWLALHAFELVWWREARTESRSMVTADPEAIGSRRYKLRTSLVKPPTKMVVSAQPTAITAHAAQRVQPVGSQSPAWPKSTIGRNVSAA